MISVEYRFSFEFEAPGAPVRVRVQVAETTLDLTFKTMNEAMMCLAQAFEKHAKKLRQAVKERADA